jgi:(p)ppGpp synthase/HD superfamily hydrolase
MILLVNAWVQTKYQHLLTKLLWDARKVYKTAFWKPWFDYPLVVSQANNLRVMLLGMVDDPRVVLIKLADRLHNMRTMYATLALSSLFSMSCLLLVS